MTARPSRRLVLGGLLLLLVAACGPESGTQRAGVTPPDASLPEEAPLSDEDRERIAVAIEALTRRLPERVGEILGPLLERDPVPVDAQYAAGQAAYTLGRYGEAIERLADAVARRPELLPRSASLGFAHYKLGDFDAARVVFEDMTETDPDAVKAWYGLGQVALTVGETAVARGHLERALELQPSHLKARFSLARVHEVEGRFDAALTEVQAVVEQWPSHEEALYLLANVLRALGRDAEADEVLERRRQVYEIKERIGGLEQRLRAGEDWPTLRLQMIELFLQIGDGAEAMRVLQSALSLWPQDPDLLRMAERMSGPR